MNATTTIADELALRAQVTELRAVLARIEGYAASAAGATHNPLAQNSFNTIVDMARAALDADR